MSFSLLGSHFKTLCVAGIRARAKTRDLTRWIERAEEPEPAYFGQSRFKVERPCCAFALFGFGRAQYRWRRRWRRRRRRQVETLLKRSRRRWKWRSASKTGLERELGGAAAWRDATRHGAAWHGSWRSGERSVSRRPVGASLAATSDGLQL